MPTKRHNIRFPASDTNGLSQDETYFTLVDAGGVETQIRFHNYDAIYAHQGLYEQLFYDRLQCHSPEKVVAILHHAMAEEPWLFNELRVLDLGAGNGMKSVPSAGPGVPSAPDSVPSALPGLQDGRTFAAIGPTRGRGEQGSPVPRRHRPEVLCGGADHDSGRALKRHGMRHPPAPR